jgi:hypothetical protein
VPRASNRPSPSESALSLSDRVPSNRPRSVRRRKAPAHQVEGDSLPDSSRSRASGGFGSPQVPRVSSRSCLWRSSLGRGGSAAQKAHRPRLGPYHRRRVTRRRQRTPAFRRDQDQSHPQRCDSYLPRRGAGRPSRDDPGGSGGVRLYLAKREPAACVSNFRRRVWWPGLERAGLPHELRIHDLRHTCATMLISRGVHPKAIQHHLGHANIDITMNRYGHLLPDQLNDLAAQLDAAHGQRLPGSGWQS